MKTALATTAAAALLGAVSAQDFQIFAQTYWGTPGDFWGPYKTYYGDGNMYVGPGEVPASLENVLDYKTSDWSMGSDIRVGPLPPATDDDLPPDSYFAINNGTGAAEPIFFSNDEGELGETDINKWVRWGTFVVPRGPTEVSTETHFYLEPTEEDDTFRVTWRTPGAPDEGLQRVNLTAILPN